MTTTEVPAGRGIDAEPGGAGSEPPWLPLGLPDLGEAELSAVAEVFASGWLSSGRRVEEFERRLTAYTGATDVVAVSSCTAALHLSLLVAGVGPGDEVITTPITWPATVNVIRQVGATPVLADVDRTTLNLAPEAVAAQVTDRTAAIIPVHLGGRPADIGALHEIAARCGAVVIEDAAHALGARHGSQMIGSLSRFTCFSFYPTKSITTGEGGAVACLSREDAVRVRVLASHGMSRTAWTAGHSGDLAAPAWVATGYKYNLSDVAAAIGAEQVPRLEGFLATRTALSDRYRSGLAGVPGLLLPPPIRAGRSSWHLFSVRVTAGIGRDALAAGLRRAGVGTGVHYRALHRQPAFRAERAAVEPRLPVATEVGDQLLSLPLYTRMTFADVDRVCREVRRLVHRS